MKVATVIVCRVLFLQVHTLRLYELTRCCARGSFTASQMLWVWCYFQSEREGEPPSRRASLFKRVQPLAAHILIKSTTRRSTWWRVQLNGPLDKDWFLICCCRDLSAVTLQKHGCWVLEDMFMRCFKSTPLKNFKEDNVLKIVGRRTPLKTLNHCKLNFDEWVV